MLTCATVLLTSLFQVPGLRGSILLDQCHVEGTPGSGVYIGTKSNTGASVTVRDSSFDNVALCSGVSCAGMGQVKQY